jgi:hypothetical protein
MNRWPAASWILPGIIPARLVCGRALGCSGQYQITDALVIGDRDCLALRRVNKRERNSAMFAID